MGNIKISIIIPAYNVENYVQKCILSCTDQDLNTDEYEIIIVNDGSSDNTLEIIELSSQNYSNIKIISKKNEGLSAARNDGLKAASGKYVWFVDSDDWIRKDCLKYIFNVVSKHDLDALWIELDKVNENGSPIPFQRLSRKYITDVLSGDQFLKLVMGYHAYAVLFIFNRDFLLEEGLQFTRGIYYEDAEFVPRALLLAQRVKYVPNVFYYYQIRANSIIQSDNPKRIDDLIFVMQSLKRAAEENKTHHDVSYIKSFLSVLLISTLKFSSNPIYEYKRSELLLKIRELGLKRIKIIRGFRMTVLTLIYNISPRLFLNFCKVGRSLAKLKLK